MAILGVDVGGTFTDAVLLDDGRISTGKVLTAARQEDSVLAAARAAGADAVERFAHGTTVATNALLERKGARTAFVTNAGFEHLLHLRRQTRAHLYRLCAPQPEPLVPLARSFGVRGRMGPSGELTPLELESLPEFEAEAVAVCLLHADRYTEHEAAVVAEGRQRLPRAHGAALLARRAGFENAIGLDMGGTSADVSLIVGGRPERVSERAVGGLPVRLPTVDVHTVGAGGGSMAWRDRGGNLRVGPQSAGADPGPASYGRGGRDATVTDANLLLGRLPETLAGGVRLDRAAAERALDDVDPSAVVDVVNAEMLRALRLVSVERGHDPASFALVAFGGAGALHACELADELGSSTVVVPEAAGVLSALGLVASDERRDHVRSYLCPLRDAGELPPEGEADLRYRGQSFELTLPLEDDLENAFHRAHEERYGFADRERTVELVAVRTAEVRPAADVELPGGDRQVASGPVRIDLAGATLWIPPGWVGGRDGATWIVTRV